MATMPVINDSQLAVDPKYYTSITDTSTVEAPLFPTAVVMTASWSPSAIPSSPSNARTRGGLSGQGIVIVSAILTITTLIAALFLWSLWKRRQVMRRERAAVNFLIVLASKRTHGSESPRRGGLPRAAKTPCKALTTSAYCSLRDRAIAEDNQQCHGAHRQSQQ